MIKKRANTKWLKLVAEIITLLVLTHTFYIFYSSNKQELQVGISGSTVTEETSEASTNLATNKRLILGGEWLLVISILIVTLIKAKMELQTVVDEVIITPQKTRPSISRTDIDSMYDIVKEKKRLKVRTLAKYFKVDDNTILEWARVLEEENLITVHSPTIGDPQIILNEEVKQDELKEK